MRPTSATFPRGSMVKPQASSVGKGRGGSHPEPDVRERALTLVALAGADAQTAVGLRMPSFSSISRW